jgi:hypothetical protein
MRRLLTLAVAAGAVWLAVVALPDIRRYLEIRDM